MDYEVGYGKPPKHRQFKKGQSGNPRGRPKGVLNMAAVLERMLRKKVNIRENSKNKVMTKLEAAVNQLINKAATGNLRAVHLLTVLVRSAEERAVQDDPVTLVSTEIDERVVLSILKRIESTEKEDTKNEAEHNSE
jgi:hypothetical protein